MKNPIIVFLFLFITVECSAQISVSESITRQIQFLKGERPSFLGEVLFSDRQDTLYGITDTDMPTGTKYQASKSVDGYVTVTMSKEYLSYDLAKADMNALIDAVQKSYPGIILVGNTGNLNTHRSRDDKSFLARSDGRIFICNLSVRKSPNDGQFTLSGELRLSGKSGH